VVIDFDENRRHPQVSGTANIVQRRLVATPSSPIVVFAWFKETCYRLQSALVSSSESIYCECLTGDILDNRDRQALVDRFQSGEIDVLICTFGVGSVGTSPNAT
jgi:superfamily II DNA or RNA helicase